MGNCIKKRRRGILGRSTQSWRPMRDLSVPNGLLRNTAVPVGTSGKRFVRGIFFDHLSVVVVVAATDCICKLEASTNHEGRNRTGVENSVGPSAP